MFGATRVEHKDDIVTKLLNSKTEIPVTEVKTLSSIINDAKKLNRDVIISIISEAKSALSQIEAFGNAAAELNADIYVVHKQALTFEKFSHVKFIRDDNDTIKKEIGIFVEATLVIKSNGKNKTITLPALINEEFAKKHITEILQFIQVQQNRVGFTCP